MGSDDKEKDDIDVKDLENGPLTEANRECRDTLCCLLFIAGICAMVYLGVYGFSKGNTYVMYRGVDSNGVECGKTGGVAELFPYLYFTNPLFSITNRACVSSCPSWTGTTVSATTCYNAASLCNSNTYSAIYSTSGTLTSGTDPTAISTGFAGYDSSLTLGRVCIPNTNMFTTAFAAISSSFSSAVNQGALADFVNDIKNVQI